MRPTDISEAFALLTRLPVPAHEPRGGASAWAWPIVGLVVGTLAVAVGAGAWALGLPAPIVAGLMLGVQVIATGGLHEDGLADTADGFWGGRHRERRLEIMKDSRIGSYGVLALIIVFGLNWAALSHLIDAGHLAGPILVAAVLSRAAMAWQMAALPFARSGGLAAGVGRPGTGTAATAVALAVIGALLLADVGALFAVLGGALATVATGRIAMAKIGGQTGDVLGATQQITATTVLVVLAALT